MRNGRDLRDIGLQAGLPARKPAPPSLMNRSVARLKLVSGLRVVEVQSGDIFTELKHQQAIFFTNDGPKLFQDGTGIPIGGDEPRSICQRHRTQILKYGK